MSPIGLEDQDQRSEKRFESANGSIVVDREAGHTTRVRL